MVVVPRITVIPKWPPPWCPATMGGFSVFTTLLLGVKFIVRPVMTTKGAPPIRAAGSAHRGVPGLRQRGGLHLRLYRRWRRYDDASGDHLGAWL